MDFTSFRGHFSLNTISQTTVVYKKVKDGKIQQESTKIDKFTKFTRFNKKRKLNRKQTALSSCDAFFQIDARRLLISAKSFKTKIKSEGYVVIRDLCNSQHKRKIER